MNGKIAKPVTFKIDGKEFTAERGTSILKVALDNGIRIPHMCHHSELSTYGVCRICLVEVFDGRKRKITASCTYPAMEGIEVSTNSDKVKKHRNMNMELLLARCATNPEFVKLAKEIGVEESRFVTTKSQCYLCGNCVRICEEVVGVAALGFIERGDKRKVGVPFMEASPVCIGCGACAFNCPAKCIPVKEENGKRKIWGKTFQMVFCPTCGSLLGTEAEIEHIKKTTKNLPPDFFEKCVNCR